MTRSSWQITTRGLGDWLGFRWHGSFTGANEPAFQRAVSVFVVGGPSARRNLGDAVLNARDYFAGWLPDSDDEPAISEVAG
jgi:hypothetical protein